MFGKESVTVAGQVAVMGTALVGTGSSTLLLNLCVSPYVFRMTEVWSFRSIFITHRSLILVDRGVALGVLQK